MTLSKGPIRIRCLALLYWPTWAVCWQITAKHFEIGTADLTKLSKSSLYCVRPRKKLILATWYLQLWCFLSMSLARLCLYLVDQDFETSIVHVRLHWFHLPNEAGFVKISIPNPRPGRTCTSGIPQAQHITQKQTQILLTDVPICIDMFQCQLPCCFTAHDFSTRSPFSCSKQLSAVQIEDEEAKKFPTRTCPAFSSCQKNCNKWHQVKA